MDIEDAKTTEGWLRQTLLVTIIAVGVMVTFALYLIAQAQGAGVESMLLRTTVTTPASIASDIKPVTPPAVQITPASNVVVGSEGSHIVDMISEGQIVYPVYATVLSGKCLLDRMQIFWSTCGGTILRIYNTSGFEVVYFLQTFTGERIFVTVPPGDSVEAQVPFRVREVYLYFYPPMEE